MSEHKPVPEISDETEARIQAGIASDPENAEWTPDEFAEASPFARVFPEWAAELETGRMGGFKLVGVDLQVAAKLGQGPELTRRVNEILRRAVGL